MSNAHVAKSKKMEKISFDNYQVETKRPNLKGEWQEYAISVCDKFNVIPPYNQIIFKHAKRNLAYLKGKVTNLEDSPRFAELQKAKALGKYLISMFRK